MEIAKYCARISIHPIKIKFTHFPFWNTKCLNKTILMSLGLEIFRPEEKFISAYEDQSHNF